MARCGYFHCIIEKVLNYKLSLEHTKFNVYIYHKKSVQKVVRLRIFLIRIFDYRELIKMF